MTIERVYQGDFPLQYCTRCGVVFADYRRANEHGRGCRQGGVS